MNEADDKHNDQDGGNGKRRLLGLQIPKQMPASADSMLLDPRETEAWFDALPMANVGETARRIFSTLVEFNRTEIPDLTRAKTVEKFRPPVEYITNNLLRHYVDVGLPLSEKGWKTAALARELQKELAISYKIIIERMISGDSTRFDRKLLVISLHRALFYLGQRLLQNALVYVVWPAGIWREINSIYAYASQNQVHQIPVKSDDGHKDHTTIEDLFKALMLFASATPHRLRQSHARLLFGKTAEWATMTSILEEDDGGTSLGRFNVDLWSDAAPVHNSLRTPIPGKRIAILDVRELLKKLRGEFELAPWDSRSGLTSGEAVITRPLLRLLIMAWSRPPDRRYVRTKLNFDLHVVSGLHAIHGNLRAGESQSPFSTTRTTLFSLQEEDTAEARARAKIDWTPGSLENVSLQPLDSRPTADSMLNDSQLLPNRIHETTNTSLEEFGAPADEEPISDETERHAVTTINESAGGYCIRWKGESIPKVKIGELIGVESPSDKRRYGLGVVRWMHQRSDQSLDLGLEVISTQCEAGEVREAGKPGVRNRAPSHKALVINDTDSATTTSSSIVMNSMALDTGINLILTVGGQEKPIRLTRLVEFSSAFARYQFDVQHADEDEPDSGDKAPGSDFDDLWGTL